MSGEREERQGWQWIDRVSGEEINIMSDISKSNMHESTMPPMAQQTNSQIKDRPGGKLQESSNSYFIIKTKKQRGRLEKRRNKLYLLNYSFAYRVKFLLSLSLF